MIFGYVIASLVGALVALSFSSPELPAWCCIGIIMRALVGAVTIALLRRGIDEASVRGSRRNVHRGTK